MVIDMTNDDDSFADFPLTKQALDILRESLSHDMISEADKQEIQAHNEGILDMVRAFSPEDAPSEQIDRIAAAAIGFELFPVVFQPSRPSPYMLSGTFTAAENQPLDDIKQVLSLISSATRARKQGIIQPLVDNKEAQLLFWVLALDELFPIEAFVNKPSPKQSMKNFAARKQHLQTQMTHLNIIQNYTRLFKTLSEKDSSFSETKIARTFSANALKLYKALNPENFPPQKKPPVSGQQTSSSALLQHHNAA